MVIEGAARGRPGELAAHLLRTDHNETVNVLDIWGTGAPDLESALAEMHAIGAGARSTRTLYHANIDPRHDEQLTAQQKKIAVARLGKHLGLEGQPFVVVEHVKKGRHHLHVVWSRIDLKTMTAIHDGHNYRKHEEVANELTREFGHQELVRVHTRDKQNEPRPTPAPKFAEYQQTARAGMTPQQAKAIVTECWRQTRAGEDLRERLAAEGFTLARGDRRDFVLVDRAGGIHGLARRIEGARVRDVRERLDDLDADRLPDVAAVRRQLQKLQRQEQGREAAEIVGAAERLRLEELGREADGKLAGGARLGSSDQEAADAIWQLNRTMRGQMDAVIASTRQPLELRPRDEDNSAAKPETEPPRGFERSQAGQGPPLEKEAQTEAQRPSAVLFVRVFGWLVDHYQRAIDRRAADIQPEPVQAPAVPAQPDKPKSLFEAAKERLAARSPEQLERDRAAQRLRETEERQRKRPDEREYS